MEGEHLAEISLLLDVDTADFINRIAVGSCTTLDQAASVIAVLAMHRFLDTYSSVNDLDTASTPTAPTGSRKLTQLLAPLNPEPENPNHGHQPCKYQQDPAQLPAAARGDSR
jgi:hypothetical protein